MFEHALGTTTLTEVQTLQENVDGIRGLAGADDVLVGADGAMVYVITKGRSSNTLTAFTRDPATGALQFAQILRGGPGLFAPGALAGASDGTVYVAAETGFGSTNGGLAAFVPVTGTGAEPSRSTVRFDAVEALAVKTGAYDDAIRQVNAATVERLAIDAGDGFNTVDLLNIGAATTVTTGAGEDRITVRSATPGAAALSIQAGAGNDSVVVRELASGNAFPIPFEIQLGAGNDTIQIAGEDLPLDAAIALDGGFDTDTLLFSAGGNPIDPQTPLTPGGTIKVNDAAFGTVTYVNIEAIPGFEPSEADAGGPYGIAEGGSLTLDGSTTAATGATIASERWDLNGDGIFGDAVGASATFAWDDLKALGVDDDGVYEITLEVTDSAGNVAADTGAAHRHEPRAHADSGRRRDLRHRGCGPAVRAELPRRRSRQRPCLELGDRLGRRRDRSLPERRLASQPCLSDPGPVHPRRGGNRRRRHRLLSG